jgi:hypothetical protein
VRIARPAEEVWALVGDPARVAEWFPGIESCRVEGLQRVVTLSSGQEVTETIVTIDPLQRRFQYQMKSPLCRSHLGTLDVIGLGEHDCLVIYSTDADPATMALAIGGASGAALEHLATMLEGGI